MIPPYDPRPLALVDALALTLAGITVFWSLGGAVLPLLGLALRSMLP